MFMIIRYSNADNTATYFGPFPTESRASEYAECFDQLDRWVIVPLIVPNCVSVRIKY